MLSISLIVVTIKPAVYYAPGFGPWFKIK